MAAVAADVDQQALQAAYRIEHEVRGARPQSRRNRRLVKSRRCARAERGISLRIRGCGIEAEYPLVVEDRPERGAVALIGELLQKAPVALHRGARRGEQGQLLFIEISGRDVGDRSPIAD